MRHFSSRMITEMEQRTRVRFINSLSGFKSANLVGTIDKEGNENLSIVSSTFHLGASPALMGMIIRPAKVERHTLENILQTKSYTLNAVSSDIISAAHQTSARYSREISEFDQVGLTPYYSKSRAPFVLESPLKIELSLVSHQTLEVNGTEMVVGQVEQVIINEGAIMPDGYIDIEALDIAAITGLDSYHVTQRVSRLSYAKPNSPLHPLTREGEVTSWEAFGLGDLITKSK
ncbi:flavin reductase family protein [Vibrio sp. TBV020]|uniref:flavin reductase family protein n=1 Tax=Vibrio sp. TBV020 TaxID=3137398 RepID=UPI0038CD4E99